MEVKVGSGNYRIGKLDALKQFHIARRLAPALASIGVTVAMIEKAGKEGGIDVESFLPALGPVSEVIAKMTDTETDYVIFTCLSVVQKDCGSGQWANLVTGNQLMFQDLDMILMLRLTVEVVKFNLQGFFSELGGATTSPSS